MNLFVKKKIAHFVNSVFFFPPIIVFVFIWVFIVMLCEGGNGFSFGEEEEEAPVQRRR